MDIVLDLSTMKAETLQGRQHMIAEILIAEISAVLRKYSFKEFEAAQFVSDLSNWLFSTGWIIKSECTKGRDQSGNE